MIERNRDVLFLLGVAALVSLLIAVMLWPQPPNLPSYDLVEHPDPRYQPGGIACRSGGPVVDDSNATNQMDRCTEAIEQNRLQRGSLIQQAREANAAEAQAVLAYNMAWMVLIGTIGGVFTLFAAGAAAFFARDGARSAKASLGHATEVSEAELRPWLQVEIVPDRFQLTENKALARYVVRIKNVGKRPASGVYTGGRIFNLVTAKTDVPEYFGGEFVPPEEREPRTILPLGEIMLRGKTVARARDQLDIKDSDGKPHLAAVLAVRVLYEWGDGRQGRTCQSYQMLPHGGGSEEGPQLFAINPDGETRRSFEVKQTQFDHIR
jgi:hypothetical protein